MPELIGRLHGKDAIARVHIINILSRFNMPEVQTALLAQLKDPHKLIRGASLGALQKMDNIVDVQRLCALLRDPRNRCAEQGRGCGHQGQPPRYRSLPDRCAEGRKRIRPPLGGRGSQRSRQRRSVKYLLQALKDSDWWVRSRAADALGKIGGPKVIEAVLQLVQDKDEDIRRAAIEILNQTKDERAVDHLIQATRDNDWWVSERAIDALAEIGSKRAMPRLLEMLKAGNAKALPVVVRALGKLGEPQHIDAILPCWSGRNAKSASRPSRRWRSSLMIASRAGARRPAKPARFHGPDRGPAGHGSAGGNGCAHRQQSDHHAWNPDIGSRPGGARLDECSAQAPRRHHAFRHHRDAGGRFGAGAQAGRNHAAGYQCTEDRRHHRGPLQVHRPASAAARSAPCC